MNSTLAFGSQQQEDYLEKDILKNIIEQEFGSNFFYCIDSIQSHFNHYPNPSLEEVTIFLEDMLNSEATGRDIYFDIEAFNKQLSTKQIQQLKQHITQKYGAILIHKNDLLTGDLSNVVWFSSNSLKAFATLCYAGIKKTHLDSQKNNDQDDDPITGKLQSIVDNHIAVIGGLYSSFLLSRNRSSLFTNLSTE